VSPRTSITQALVVVLATSCGGNSAPSTAGDTKFESDGAAPPPDAAPPPPARPGRVYVGSADGKIRLFEFDSRNGSATLSGTFNAGKNPSFMAFDAASHFLYAVDEGAGQINVFSIAHGTGNLELLQTVPSGGAGPTYITLDRQGRLVMVANYTAGTVALFPRMPDGRLSTIVTTRSFGGDAQTHAIVPDPSNQIVAVANKGKDSVSLYRLNESSLTDLATVPAGKGARHIAFDPGGKRAYVVNEGDNTISAYTFYAPAGTFTPLQTISTLPPGVTSNSNTAAEIAVLGNGKNLLVSNRGDDSLMLYTISSIDGQLTFSQRFASGGSSPRQFRIDDSGRFLLVGNQGSNAVRIMRVDANGVLTPTATLSVPSPAFVSLVYVDP
jgi:6-phosphogluconolactonase